MQRFSLGVLSLLGIAHFVPAQCTTPWLPGSTQTDGRVRALAIAANGDVIAGGEFTQIEGVAADYIARWDGTTWHPIGGGTSGTVYALGALRNGDLIVGGDFATAGGVAVAGIARWNGTSWAPLGAGWKIPGGPGSADGAGYPMSILERADGSIAAAGWRNPPGPFAFLQIHAATWDGAAWTALPLPVAAGSCAALIEDGNGNLLVGGAQWGSGFVVRWDGTNLQTIATSPFGVVAELARTQNGELVAAGFFDSLGGTAAQNVATWNGSTWSPLGSGLTAPLGGATNAIAVLPNGDLVVAGAFSAAGGAPASRIARWDGATWSTFGPGVGASEVMALAFPPSGPLFVGGQFTQAGGAAVENLARVGTTCPTSTVPYGAGCASSGGSNTFVANVPPWIDATFTATATGLPANALLVTLTSLTSIPQGIAPLASIFVEGIPGCDVLVAPDILAAQTTTTGTATSSFFLPGSPPIVGVPFFHQMIPFEIGGAGFVEITATNALQLVSGSF